VLLAVGSASGPLHEVRHGADVDWTDGTLTAEGGAAADLRMPSAELSRPGAVRRARATALTKLKAALEDLPLGGGRTLPAPAVERALGRARTVDVAYQSNGGALVRVAVDFTDWIDAPATAPVATLSVAGPMHLGAAPLARIDGKEGAVGAARYRLGPAPSDAGALRARLDHGGRLVVDDVPVGVGDKLAHGAVLIYVQKVLR
jgi:hypothetical protein